MSNTKKAFYIWFISIVIFVSLIIFFAPMWAGISFGVLLFDVLVGVLAFVAMIFYAFSKGSGSIYISKKFGLTLFIVIAVVLFFVFMTNSVNDSSTKPTSSQQIECYVNGRRIMATREDCQALSVQKEPKQPVVIEQWPTIRSVPFPTIPRIKTTNCQWFGSILNCTEY